MAYELLIAIKIYALVSIMNHTESVLMIAWTGVETDYKS